MTVLPESDLDDTSPVIEAGGLRFVRAAGCFRDLNWNLDSPTLEGGEPALRGGLKEAGWCETSPIEGLYDFVDHDLGHHLVWVPSAQWLQLRLSYLVPVSARRSEVQKVSERIAALLTAGTTHRSACLSARR
jgi:hypothetical protein